jgi:hypothetical protein
MSNNNKLFEYIIRDSILKLLSDDEAASVSTAETAARILDGEEYLDLERINQGVQRAGGTTRPMAFVLPRKGMRVDTWRKILKRLAVPHIAAARSNA